MDKALQIPHPLLNMEGNEGVSNITTLCSNFHSSFCIPPWKRSKSPTTDPTTTHQASFMMNGATSSSQCRTSSLQFYNQFISWIKTCCIKIGFAFMNIEFIPFNYYKFHITEWTDPMPHISHQVFNVFVLLTFFPFLFFQDISFEILEIFPRILCLVEVEGKAISRDQVWTELKATLGTEILCIDT